MAIGLLDRVASAAAACSRHVSRTSRRLWPRIAKHSSLLARRANGIRLLGPKRQIAGEEAADGETTEDEVEEEEGVWRRTILMGEKCQPLDFSGAIYYDADGRQLAKIPNPRSPRAVAFIGATN